MAFVRSLRDIPLDEEPHASVLAALLPHFDPDDESPDKDALESVNWANASAYQLAHLAKCPQCVAVLGGYGRVCIPAGCDTGISIGRS